MELPPDQIAIITAITTVGAWLLVFLWMRILRKPKPPEMILKALAFGVSLALAFVWTPLELPPFSADPTAFVTALISVAIVVFKFAQLLYDYVWQKLLDAISNVPVLGLLSTRRFPPPR